MASTRHKLKACDICASIKQVCEREGGNQSCIRCTRLSLTCAITRVHKPMGRPPKLRTRLAPRTLDTENGAMQIGGTGSFDSFDLPMTPRSPRRPRTPLSGNVTLIDPTGIEDELETLDAFLGYRDEKGTCSSSVPDSPPSSGTCAASTSTVQKRTKRERSYSGCVTCKKRRKKCNEAYPICGECKRLDLECIRPPTRTRRRSISKTPVSPAPEQEPETYPEQELEQEQEQELEVENLESVEIIPRTQNRYGHDFGFGSFSQTPDFLWPQGVGRFEAELLRYYVVSTSKCLSVVPDEMNPFLSEFLQIALTRNGTAFKTGLLSLSASHMRRALPQNLHQQEVQMAMRSYQDQAERAAYSLVQPGRSWDEIAEGLGAYLLLCIQEVCDAGNTRWSQYLEKAGRVINYYGGPASFPSQWSFILEATAYFDATATLCSFRPPIIDHNFYPSIASRRGSYLIATPHALFGTAHDLYPILGRMARLAQDRTFRHSSQFTQDAFGEKVLGLHNELQSWEPPINNGSLSSDPNLLKNANYAALAMQWALFLWLHQLDKGYNNSDREVRKRVDMILRAIQAIDEGSAVESQLALPMFMAGICAVNHLERQIVRDRFQVIEKSVGFGNIAETHEVVERVWAKMDRAPGRILCWEDEVCSHGKKLIVS